jgi:tetratricopeptide (TPR) repeat protein
MGTVTQEFHISVTPVGNDEYLVRTERVAPGVPLAEEQMVWQTEEWLTQAHQLMNDPLVGLLQGYGAHRVGGFELPEAPGDTPPSIDLVVLGQSLYDALFQGTLRDSWLTAQGIAQHRGEVLRLRLGLKGTRLPRLPWEVLHSSDGAGERLRSPYRSAQVAGRPPRPLATGTDVIFSRYQPGIGLAASGVQFPLESDQPLRILMAIAAPNDQEQLNLRQEASLLQRELLYQSGPLPEGMVGTLPEIQVTLLEQPGREQLTQALEQGQFQVFHFAGHSDLGASGGNLYLVNRKTGLTETLSGDDLAGLLVNNGIRMAVFNSCRGAYTATSEPGFEEDRNLAEALVSRGIPAVLAMAERIPDDVALTLTRLFYRNLKQGYPVDLSLSRARQGLISAYGSNQLYWALPILYLHPEFDGYLVTSDRTFDNPADSLARLPRVYDPLLPSTKTDGSATSNESRYSDSGSDWAVISETVLSPDDLSSPQDELEYPDNLLADDLLIDDSEDSGKDLSPVEDEFVVANLIQELTQQSETQPIATHKASGKAGSEAGSALSETRANANATATTQKLKQTRSLAGLKLQFGQFNRPRAWLSLGAVGVLAIALFSYWSITRKPGVSPDISKLPDLINQVPASPSQVDFKTIETSELTAIAISAFRQDKLTEAQQAIEELLSQRRNALNQARSALAAVPANRVGNPAINFLQGRLAWQSIQVNDPSFSVDDARRYWEFAVKQAPNVAEYHEALGFAYYAEGNSRAAIQAWAKTLSLLQAKATGSPTQKSTPSDVALPTQPLAGEDALTAYAGIALALMQASADPSSAQQTELMSKAVKLHQMVMTADPTAFQPDALDKKWLWTQSAIQNWQTLSTLKH